MVLTNHGQGRHETALEQLICSELPCIGEPYLGIQSLIIEPMIYRDEGLLECSPDLIICRRNIDPVYTVVELKCGKNGTGHAIEQIESGINMLVSHYRASPGMITGKLVRYQRQKYTFEITHIGGMRCE